VLTRFFDLGNAENPENRSFVAWPELRKPRSSASAYHDINSWSDVMAKTERMVQIEAMLAEEPNDSFLRYGLAMEHMSQGDDAEAVRVLRELMAIAEPPYVPAYLQGGQALIRMGKESQAAEMLRAGIEVARRLGDQHALGEMEGFLATVE
jgi:predicted Zn-dependent protease